MLAFHVARLWQQVAHDLLHDLQFGTQALVALDDRDVAEHVADATVDVAVVTFDHGLPFVRAAHDQDVGGEVEYGAMPVMPGRGGSPTALSQDMQRLEAPGILHGSTRHQGLDGRLGLVIGE